MMKSPCAASPAGIPTAGLHAKLAADASRLPGHRFAQSSLSGRSTFSGVSNGSLAVCTVVSALASCKKRSCVAARRCAKTSEPSVSEMPDQDQVEPPQFDPAQQVGALPPLGYFDPLGFCKVGDEAGFQKFRTQEIKHGRVAMMAAIGAVGQHYLAPPLFEAVYPGFSALPKHVDIMREASEVGLFFLFVFTALLEKAWDKESWEGKDEGNFGDPLGLNMYTTEMRNKELNNGRFAMFSTLGIVVAQLATGKDAVEQLGLS